MRTQRLPAGLIGNRPQQIKVPFRFNLPGFINNDDGNRI